MNSPPVEAVINHEAHVENFSRVVFWIFEVSSLAFIVAGMLFVI